MNEESFCCYMKCWMQCHTKTKKSEKSASNLGTVQWNTNPPRSRPGRDMSDFCTDWICGTESKNKEYSCMQSMFNCMGKPREVRHFFNKIPQLMHGDCFTLLALHSQKMCVSESRIGYCGFHLPRPHSPTVSCIISHNSACQRLCWLERLVHSLCARRNTPKN